MKKLLALLLCFLMILSVCFVPIYAETNNSVSIKSSIGKYYKFTFGEDGDRYDYNSVLNNTINYKNNTFYPFWHYTDKTNVSPSLTYKTITDSSGKNGVDVLQLSTDTATYITPLTSDGKPFEVEPGKDYVIKINAFVETDTDYSQLMMLLSGPNKRVDSWFQSYYNTSRTVTGIGCYGASTLNNVKFYNISTQYVSDVNTAIGCLGFTPNNGSNWATGHKGTTTDTATRIEKTCYISVPSNEQYNVDNFAVYDQVNDSYSFNFPKHKANDLSAIDADGDGNTDLQINNNYLTLFFTAGTTDVNGVKMPFTYDIVSIEIWENGFTPGIEMIVNDEVVKTVSGEDRENVPYFTPKAQYGKYFSGWYSDKQLTNVVDSSSLLPPSITKLYAGFKEYKNEYTMDMNLTNIADSVLKYPSFLDNDAKGNYYGFVDRAGYSFKKFENGAASFYSIAPWGEGGNFLICDENGDAFVAEPNSKYIISVKFKVDDIITKEEVGALPDGSSYGGGYVAISAGAGVETSFRRGMTNNKYYHASESVEYRETTDWIEKEFTVETASLSEILPVIGLYVSTYGVPYKFDSNGNKLNEQPGNLNFGYNNLLVSEITVKKCPKVTFKDNFGNVLSEKNYIQGEKIDFSGILTKNTDIIVSNGKGYTVSDFAWYSDEALSNPVDTKNTVAISDVTFYANVTPVVAEQDGLISYYGFEDMEIHPEKFTITAGYNSAKAIKASDSTYEINVARNNTDLDDTKSYLVSFYYKANEDSTVLVGNKEVVLPKADSWTKYTVTTNSVKREICVALKQGSVTLDTFSVYNVVSLKGAAILNEDAEKLAKKQALRVFASYCENLNVKERGIVIYAGETLSLINENTDGIKLYVKNDNLSDCWEIKNGELTFSNYIKDFYFNDTRTLTVRAYVITSDNNKYYSEQKTYSVKNIKEYYNLIETPIEYSFTNSEVLDLVNIQSAYQKTTRGITFDWSGSTVEVNAYCVGDVTFNIYMHARVGSAYYSVYVDGERIPGRLLPVENSKYKNEYSVTINVGETPKVHSIVFSRGNEAYYETFIELQGITLNGTLLKKEANETLIEFVGDSMTCGWGVSDSCANNFYADGTKTYAYLASRELGVDYRIRSHSGSGFEYASNGLNGIPYAWNDMYRCQNPFRSSTVTYAPQRTADVVCIYLGTNDSSGWKSVNARGVRITEDEDYAVSKMKEFIALVKSFNPNAKIVWINGGMTDEYAQCSVRAITELGGETAGYYNVSFPKSVSGDQGHPDRTEHRVMANILKDFLIEKDLV